MPKRTDIRSILIIGEPGRELLNTMFWLKMSMLVCVLIITGTFQYLLRSNGSAFWETRRAAAALVGIVSLLLWVSIVAAGRWIAYVEHGPTNGWPVILSHGFPYDVHSFDEVASILARAGARVITPYTRGFGPTRFISDDVMRSGQQAARGDGQHHVHGECGHDAQPDLPGLISGAEQQRCEQRLVR